MQKFKQEELTSELDLKLNAEHFATLFPRLEPTFMCTVGAI